MELMDLIANPTHPLHGTPAGSAIGCICPRCSNAKNNDKTKAQVELLGSLMASARKNTVVIHYPLADKDGGDRLIALPAMEA